MADAFPLRGKTRDAPGYVAPVDDASAHPAHVSHFGALKAAPTIPVVEGNFPGDALSTTRWVSTTTGSGSITVEDGLGKLSTGAASSSSYTLRTRQPGRFQAGQVSVMQTGVHPVGVGVAGSKREWGLRDVDGNNGLFFREEDGVFSVVTLTGGTETVTPAASFSAQPGYTVDDQNRTWRIEYSAGRALFYDSDGGRKRLLHVAVDTTQPLTTDLDLYGFLTVENTTATTDTLLHVRGFSISIWGHLSVADLVFAYATPGDGALPSGSPITIHPAGPNGDANAVDSGWVSRQEGSALFTHVLSDVALNVYVLNASDEQGSNLVGDTFPSLVTAPGAPATISAPFFDQWVRVVIENVSGSTATELTASSRRMVSAVSPVFQSIDQNVQGFFPAPLTQSVIKGQQPDGDFVAAKAGGAAFTTTATLGAGEEYESDWFDTDGFQSVELFIASDQVSAIGGIEVEFTDDAQATTPVARGAPRVFSFTAADVTNGFRIVRFAPALDGLRVRYRNGATAQGTFFLGMTLYTGATEQPRSELSAQRGGQDPALTTVGTVIAPDDGLDYQEIGRDGEGRALNVALTQSEADVAIKPQRSFRTGQVNLTSTGATQIPPPTGLTTVRGLDIVNLEDDVTAYIGRSSVTAQNGHAVPPLGGLSLGIDDSESVFGVIPDDGNVSSEYDLAPTTTDSSSNVTNPDNAHAADGVYAAFTSAGSTATYSGFPGTATIGATVQKVELEIGARKQPGAPGETASFQSTVGSKSTDATQIISPTVTADADACYLVAFSRRDEFADIISITNTMGLTGSVLVADSGNAAESRTTVYRMTGTPTQDGTITVRTDTGFDYGVLSVTKVTGIDKTDPIVSSSIGANNSASSYSGSLTGLTGGLYYAAIGSEQMTHNNTGITPAGASERFDDGDSGNNNQRQAIVVGASPNGSFSYGGAFTGGPHDVTVVAVALRPSAANNISVRVGHSEGPTELTASVSSSTLATFTQDVTDDAAWTPTLIDGMTVDVTADNESAADLQVDFVRVVVTDATSLARISYLWVGDE